MKILLDLFPLFVFFGSYRIAKGFPDALPVLVSSWVGALSGTPSEQLDLAAFIAATVFAVAATAVQIAWMLLRRLAIPPAVLLSAILIAVFGGLTVWFHNEWFIKWKPTVLYWMFALILGAGHWIWRKNLLGALLSGEMNLPTAVWNRLLLAWVGFFATMGCLNLIVAYSWSTEVWVNFKTFGLIGCTLAFSLLTGIYVSPYLKGDTPAGNDAT